MNDTTNKPTARVMTTQDIVINHFVNKRNALGSDSISYVIREVGRLEIGKTLVAVNEPERVRIDSRISPTLAVSISRACDRVGRPWRLARRL